jgi:hypothetical protein
VATTAVLAGTAIYNTPPYAFRSTDSVDWGSADLAATLFTGDLRVEEFDQYLSEIRYVRGVTIPMVISGGTVASAVANTQALGQLFADANRFAPVDFVFTPNSGHASTFKVIGGGIEAPFDVYQDNIGYVKDAVLHLQCLPWIYGAAQNLGSSGAPLITNQASPANVTLSPSPVGDVPGDVTLFVKNRSASAIRSMIASCIGLNTTWVASSNASGWTADAAATIASGIAFTTNPATADTVLPHAHFTAPTLPSDRPFRLYLRAAQSISFPDYIKFRVRLVSGANEIVGQWVAIPQENFANTTPFTTQGWQLVDMGVFYLPVGEVGLLGGQSTTVYIEAFTHNTGNAVGFQQAVFLPNSSTLIAETQDTTKTLAAAAGIVRLESDSIYDNSGNPAGGTVLGAHIRSQGGRYVIYTSQYSMNTLDKTQPFTGENVDAWAVFTPRYLGLA